ncbi:alpha/beta hydrolase [Geodermatophilus sabuli]|uniref:TAP-like protein n=1 Tax=Geodermatophilus sabuli TaxID=1564158 RepID=A0A285EHQ8_9ACTN|nr:alpha/beta hydrolase [Geodermatophilus sabuli]MBB3083889.1 pimeloyl-ACP methyl ester carboxylesterase [Geodermatophilus sabuli]SNX98540.1 TAP-like protein [Geodermatophilus sabuli]
MTPRRTTVVGGLVALLLGAAPAVANAQPEAPPEATPVPVPTLVWAPCGTTPEGTAAGVECARAPLPLDHDDPGGEQVGVFVARVPATDQANRIGSLFVNFGGPGGPAAEYFQALGAGLFGLLNQRFDIVGFDPRGVGQSTPAVDCDAPPEPFPTAESPWELDVDALVAVSQRYVDACRENNGAVLEHVSTANVARDMDLLRAALGEEQLSYLGFSYGTFLGATYASLFPDRYRALVLDGAVDPELYATDPVPFRSVQLAGFEDALDRFLDACAADQAACSGFGGSDPQAAFDALLATAVASPLPAPGFPEDPTPVTADEIRAVTFGLLYAKQVWGLLAMALAAAEDGDGSLVRALSALLFPPDDPTSDAFSAIQAVDMRWPADLDPYLRASAEQWAEYPHFWSIVGAHGVVYQALWPADDADAFAGPFTTDASAPPVLVIGTTHDPATPYSGASALAGQLGNARLLTMDGDGHTAYGGNSSCVDSATDSYLVSGVLPAEGTVCPQEVPFTAPSPAPVSVVTATTLPLSVTTATGVLAGGR